MEVKNFLEHFKTAEEEKKEFFFVLQITGETVKSAIWLVEEQKVKIVSLGEEISWSDSKELLTAADASLSAAISRLDLPAGAEEPNRVIFGLPPSWVAGDKIVAERIEALKELAHKLELKPAGFVVVPEAVVYYLKVLEGVPPTAILVGVGKRRLFLSLANLGKLESNEEVGRSDNFGADVAEGLSRFGTNYCFPSRLILYNGREKVEELGQELLAYSWVNAGVNFLHLPKVEVLPPDVGVKAVALAGGQELAQAVGVMEELPKALVTPPLVEPETKLAKEAVSLAQQASQAAPEEVKLEAREDMEAEKEVVVEKKSERRWRPRLPWRFSRQAPQVLGVIVFVLGLLLLGLFALYWYWPAAEVSLGVETRPLEQELTVKLSPTASEVDSGQMILPGQLVEAEVEGEKDQAATGQKVVGELARGEVKIYNNTPKEKTFNAGALIASTSGLKFSLEEEVTIASHSSASVLAPSAAVKVAASKFGADYNLAAGTKFAVANWARSDFEAENEAAFTGGDSREVVAVAAKDQESLARALTDELKGKAKEELKAKLGKDQQLVEASLIPKVVSKEYDKKVDEEAATVGLKLKLKFSALAYQPADLQELVSRGVERLVPAGYQYQPGEAKVDFNWESLAKDGTATFKLAVKADLQPELDLPAIEKNLAGKQLELGRSYLVNLPNVKKAEIKLKPALPARLATFPHRWERIEIQLLTAE